MSEIIGVGLTLVSSFTGSIGSVLLKQGSGKFSFNLNGILKNYKLLLGLFLLGLGACIFIVALRYANLSMLYPIAAIGYIWVSLFSIYFLKEKMNLLKWFGILLIVIGAILISRVSFTI